MALMIRLKGSPRGKGGDGAEHVGAGPSRIGHRAVQVSFERALKSASAPCSPILFRERLRRSCRARMTWPLACWRRIRDGAIGQVTE